MQFANDCFRPSVSEWRCHPNNVQVAEIRLFSVHWSGSRYWTVDAMDSLEAAHQKYMYCCQQSIQPLKYESNVGGKKSRFEGEEIEQIFETPEAQCHTCRGCGCRYTLTTSGLPKPPTQVYTSGAPDSKSQKHSVSSTGLIILNSNTRVQRRQTGEQNLSFFWPSVTAHSLSELTRASLPEFTHPFNYYRFSAAVQISEFSVPALGRKKAWYSKTAETCFQTNVCASYNDEQLGWSSQLVIWVACLRHDCLLLLLLLHSPVWWGILYIWAGSDKYT